MNPVESTQSCTGTMIFFSHVTQSAMMRLPLTSPFVPMQRSLPILFVASLVSHAMLQNSVKRGRNAVLLTDGMHISKKFVSTSGCELSAMFTSAHTVNTVSLLHLSHKSKSKYTSTLPVMQIFCVPKIGVPIHFSSHSEVSA